MADIPTFRMTPAIEKWLLAIAKRLEDENDPALAFAVLEMTDSADLLVTLDREEIDA